SMWGACACGVGTREAVAAVAFSVLLVDPAGRKCAGRRARAVAPDANDPVPPPLHDPSSPVAGFFGGRPVAGTDVIKASAARAKPYASQRSADVWSARVCDMINLRQETCGSLRWLAMLFCGAYRGSHLPTSWIGF